MLAKCYRDLEVYQRAMAAALEIHALARSWPAEEKYSPISQIRRASRSVCANLAEAWRRRPDPAAFASKLRDADAEAAETLVWLEFALRFGWLAREDFQRLDGIYDRIGAQLAIMARDCARWRRPA